MLTKQEVFDKVYAGLASQGFERSVAGRSDECKYRGEYGRKCAVGHLLDDAHYSARLEGRSVDHFDVLYALTESGVDTCESPGFLVAMQEAHDFSERPSEMEAALSKVAAIHGLEVKP